MILCLMTTAPMHPVKRERQTVARRRGQVRQLLEPQLAEIDALVKELLGL
jgi:hypothetical protein